LSRAGSSATIRRATLLPANEPGAESRWGAQSASDDAVNFGQHRLLEPDASMKLVEAVIQPTKLKSLRTALDKIGVTRLTVCDAQGYGRQRGRTEMYRGHEYKTNLLRKVELEILVNDDFLERTLEAIESVARTGPEGNIGDGKIFVLPCDEVVRVSDEVRGPEAV
jgi:nitrogen regulatory protein P-II 1